jgi:hypothetical protein
VKRENEDGTTDYFDSEGNLVLRTKPYIVQCEADRCLRKSRDIGTDYGGPRVHPGCQS